jgi:hypothetical protein
MKNKQAINEIIESMHIELAELTKKADAVEQLCDEDTKIEFSVKYSHYKGFYIVAETRTIQKIHQYKDE